MNVNFSHLFSISDARGVFEHCKEDQPRIEHGYCVDDVSRALIIAERESMQTPRLIELINVCTDFLTDAQATDGCVVNRCDVTGQWFGPADTRDHWGRAMWAWGTVVGRSSDADRVAAAYERFSLSAGQSSPFLRSNLFAALGAIEVLSLLPNNRTALNVLENAVDAIPNGAGLEWPWPEARLTYANAAIPEVLIRAGAIFGDRMMMRRGNELLRWLIAVQTRQNMLSVIPAGGWSASEHLRSFDQQPIEVAALVDACSAAYEHSQDEYWRSIIFRAVMWFEGLNASGVLMYDPKTGAGFDGLIEGGRNPNRGAESTLAYLSVMQASDRFVDIAQWS